MVRRQRPAHTDGHQPRGRRRDRMLFQPTRLDERARTLSGSIQPRSQWAQATADASSGRRRFDDLIDTAARPLPPEMQAELMSRVLGILVVELALADPVGNAVRRPPDDLFDALSAEIDAKFATTRNTKATTPGNWYTSARTLNRSALRNTGLTVKQLVDQRRYLSQTTPRPRHRTRAGRRPRRRLPRTPPHSAASSGTARVSHHWSSGPHGRRPDLLPPNDLTPVRSSGGGGGLQDRVSVHPLIGGRVGNGDERRDLVS